MTTELERRARAYRRADELREQRRAELAEAIAQAAAEGVRQVDIVRQTGYTRESVRRIVAEAERQR